MFTDFRQSVKESKVIIRSKELLKECGVYVYKNGKIEHALVAGATDDAKGVSHGDRVIGAAIALQGSKDCASSSPNSEFAAVAKAPSGSFAERHNQFLSDSQQKDFSDEWKD